jgi:Flp pilus assembly protein TadD
MFEELMGRPDVKAVTAVARGIAAEQDEDWKSAEGAYRRALALDPNAVVAQNNLALVLLRHGGDVSEAVRLAKGAVEKRPDVATLRDTLALVQAGSKDMDGAVASLRRAVELEPNVVDWRVHLARVLLDGGKAKEAERALGEIAMLPAGRTPPSEAVRGEMERIRAELSRQSSVSLQSP